MAQSEERVVSNDEAPGSKPGFSIHMSVAPIVQRLEYVVANDVVRVRLPVGASINIYNYIRIVHDGVVGNISPCHGDARGSIPRRGVINNNTIDTLAEWLRRRPAKPLGSARAGSNPAGVVGGSHEL